MNTSRQWISEVERRRDADDRHTVCRLFADEPGVVVIGNRETRRGQGKYRMLRVPTAVLNR